MEISHRIRPLPNGQSSVQVSWVPCPRLRGHGTRLLNQGGQADVVEDLQQRIEGGGESCFLAGFFNRTKLFETVRVYATHGGTDEAILYDATLDAGLTSRPIEGPAAEFAKVAWLYDFERCYLGERSSDADPVPQAVDRILTAYWP